MFSQATKIFAVTGLVAAFAGLSATDAEARHRRGHHAQHHQQQYRGGGGGFNAGPAIALGIGAIALGAIIASQNQQQQQYYQPQYQQQQSYGYYQQPQPRYVQHQQMHRYETRYDDYGRPYRVRVQCYERYPNAPQGNC
jgi:hypothetical protein